MKELGYMGDGVYLSHDGFQFWLAVDHHNNKAIALEPETVSNVVRAMCKLNPEVAHLIHHISSHEMSLHALEDDTDDNANS